MSRPYTRDTSPWKKNMPPALTFFTRRSGFTRWCSSNTRGRKMRPTRSIGRIATTCRSSVCTIHLTAAAFVLICAHTAFACDGPSNMPGWDFDVRFDNNSSDLSTSELAKLSVWSNNMRNRFPIVDVVSVVGLAEPTERSAQALAHRRAANVKSALDQFLIRGERNSMIARIYKLPFPASEFDDNGRRVEITFGPGCPNHCCPNLNPIPRAQ